MTHTVHMDLPIRPGDARRLGLRAPRPRGLIQFDRELTDEEAAELAKRWQVSMQYVNNVRAIIDYDVVGKSRQRAADLRRDHPEYVHAIQLTAGALQPAPRRRWWQRRNR